MINIDIAEQVIGLFDKKKSTLRKKILNDMIQQVKKRQDWIQTYLLTVHAISHQFNQKHQSLQQLIRDLDDREYTLDQGRLEISTQQKELEQRQSHMEQELSQIRAEAEQCRDKKSKCENRYNRVAHWPWIASRSRKRYVKARDRNATVEQQLSETRAQLEKCRAHLRLVSNTLSLQKTEQGQLVNQRRGSMDTIWVAQQQLEFLQEGVAFWTLFNTYQAQVVFESASYLHGLEERKKPMGLDLDQVWLKTFRFACFEYGEREAHGEATWSAASLEIQFDCDLCQTSQTGWPHVHEHGLACEFCFRATHHEEPVAKNSSKIKKLFFSFYSKIEPM